MHVDDFVEHGSEDCAADDKGTKYARWFFFLARLSASLHFEWQEYIKPFKLFCTYEGVRWRVTGASRLGDVWLTSDFNQSEGYQLRVLLETCSEWSPNEDPKKEYALHFIDTAAHVVIPMEEYNQMSASFCSKVENDV